MGPNAPDVEAAHGPPLNDILDALESPVHSPYTVPTRTPKSAGVTCRQSGSRITRGVRRPTNEVGPGGRSGRAWRLGGSVDCPGRHSIQVVSIDLPSAIDGCAPKAWQQPLWIDSVPNCHEVFPGMSRRLLDPSAAPGVEQQTGILHDAESIDRKGLCRKVGER